VSNISDVLYLEAATNRLADVPPSQLNDQCGIDVRSVFVVTFADALLHIVSVRDEMGCGWVTNGALIAQGTPAWHHLLQHYITALGTVVGSVREVGGPSPGLNRPVPAQVFATDTSGTHWRAGTTATEPFSLTLPAGTYRLTGSPLTNGGQSECVAAAPVVVVGGKTTRVEVVCDIP